MCLTSNYFSHHATIIFIFRYVQQNKESEKEEEKEKLREEIDIYFLSNLKMLHLLKYYHTSFNNIFVKNHGNLTEIK